MQPNIRTGITFGIIGGLLTFIFGGWSVGIIGVLMGTGLGLTLSNRFERTDPSKIARQAALPASVSGAVLLVLSLLQNYVIQNAIGSNPADLSIVIPANLVGVIGGILLAILTTALHGLPPPQERTAKLILLGVIVVAFPFADQFTGLGWLAQVIFALIFVILGMGLNIVVGYAGLLDLGYAAFFAIGAYTTGILSSTGSVAYINAHIILPFWLVIPVAAVVAAAAGFLLGAPTIPLRGDYLAIVTLGFGEIILVVVKNLTKITISEPLTCWIIPGILKLFGANSALSCIVFTNQLNLTAGEKGINPINRPILPFIGEFTSQDVRPWYFLIIAIILLSIFLINRLHGSRLGRAWMAIREDQLAAAQMGIDPVRTKLLAFAMGATFSGFAGAFYASYIAGIFPEAFDFSTSILILCTVILGGIGNVYGVLVGGLVLLTADRLFLPALKDFLGGLLSHTLLPALSFNHTLQSAVAQNANPILYRYLLFGLTLVIMMAVRPEGLVPNVQRAMELHAAEEGPIEGTEETGENTAVPGSKSKAKAKK
jgi:branched-chain amino acid transport system permease protein